MIGIELRSRLQELEFVKAVHAMGRAEVTIALLHIFPNRISPIFVFSTAIVLASSLSFLGLCAFAMAASIPMTQAVGGSACHAPRYQESMAEITIGRHAVCRVPVLDFQRTQLGIDISKVVSTGVLPIFDTGIAGRHGGEIGVGIARPLI